MSKPSDFVEISKLAASLSVQNVHPSRDELEITSIVKDSTDNVMVIILGSLPKDLNLACNLMANRQNSLFIFISLFKSSEDENKLKNEIDYQQPKSLFPNPSERNIFLISLTGDFYTPSDPYS